MSTIQMEVIRRGVAKAYEGIAGPGDPPRFCCTIAADSASGTPVWVQVLAGSVNMSYPFADDPVERLRAAGVRMPQALELLEWEADAYATFDVDDTSPRDVAYFVHHVLTKVLGCDTDNYEPSTAFEELEP